MAMHNIIHKDRLAQGRYDDQTQKVTILLGAILKIDLDTPPPDNIAQNYRDVRERITAGDIERMPDGQLKVIRNIRGLSPSAARVFADGKVGSGWTAWILIENQNTLETLK